MALAATENRGSPTQLAELSAGFPRLARWALRLLVVAVLCLSLRDPARADARLVDVFIDSASGHAVAVQPDGRLFAASLEDGRPVWVGAEGEAPLVRVGDGLAVWSRDPSGANRLRVAWIDPATGSRGSGSSVVELPEWVSVEPAPGHSFELEPSVQAESLRLEWRARSWYAGGAPPSRAVRESARRSAEGAVLLDPATGAVRHLAVSAEESPASARVERPFPYRFGEARSEEPIVTGERVSVLSIEVPSTESASTEITVLWSSRVGTRSEPSLTLGRADGIGLVVSLDRRNLFVCGGDGTSCRELRIHSLVDRAEVGVLADVPVPVSAAVNGRPPDGRRVYLLADGRGLEGERTLFCFDLEGGSQLWTVKVQAPPSFAPRR